MPEKLNGPLLSKNQTLLQIIVNNMAESDWDTVTVLRKKGSAAQSKSKQVFHNHLLHVDVSSSRLTNTLLL